MVRGDTWRIVIVVFRPGRRNSHACGTIIGIVALRRCELALRRRGDVSTRTSDRGLFGSAQSKNVFQSSNTAGNEPTVASPGECAPRAMCFPSIPEVYGLLKLLVMIDSEWPASNRKIAGSIVAYRRVPVKTLDIDRAGFKGAKTFSPRTAEVAKLIARAVATARSVSLRVYDVPSILKVLAPMIRSGPFVEMQLAIIRALFMIAASCAQDCSGGF